MDEFVTPSGEPERWLPVVDYEGLYDVSDLGRVRSLPRNGTPGQILRQSTVTGKPYIKVNLSRGGVTRTPRVHVLVARAFLGPCPDGHEVCHGPEGPQDNRLVNLSYGTHAKNMGPDRWRDGMARATARTSARASRNRNSGNVGNRNARAKLNDEIVLEIRARVAGGESKHSLARRFGVDRATIRSAVKGATWKHVPMPDASEPPAA